ncbi:hypothetical protein SOVF_182950, partial [Spinacia oleracea]
ALIDLRFSSTRHEHMTILYIMHGARDMIEFETLQIVR